ncbi:MAG: BON domain-containing protein [Planctomycetes bacterium]|nr:BON domain-containing protein [Planctomycetota bacterium]
MRIDRLTLVVAALATLVPWSDARGQSRPSRYQSGREVPSLFGSRTLGWPVYPKARDFGGGGAFGPRPNLGRGFQARASFSMRDGIEPMPVVPGEGFWDGLPQASPLGPQVGVGREQPNGQAPLAEQPDLAGSGLPMEGSEVWFRQPPEVGASEAAFSIETPAQASRRGYRQRSVPIGWYRTDAVLAERIRRTLEPRLRSPLEVSIDDETVVLRGTVATEHDRKMAGHVARFEPGVRFVENLLTVAGASAEPGSSLKVRNTNSAEQERGKKE